MDISEAMEAAEVLGRWRRRPHPTQRWTEAAVM